MKIAITGSKGFIGSYLKNTLEVLHDVVEWDHKGKNDIENFELTDEDYVIHLAAYANVRESVKDPQRYWKNNVDNTQKIQEKCYHNHVPLLYASSSCIHNWWLSPYGITKKVNEQTALPGQVGLRFTTVYGEGARENMFIPRLVNENVEYFTNHIRDFIHVNDVVDAIMLIMDKSINPHKYPEHTLRPYYDIGTGKGNCIADIGEWTGHINPASSFPVTDGDACEAHDNTADISALQELGWNPKIDLKKYLQEKGVIV